LDAFTFHFRPTPRGLFQVHAYPYAPGRATWIVECAEATWQRAGLREDDEAATVAHLSALFAEELGGRELEANRSIWRRFPTVRCGSWTAGRVALLGDAAHTAHFSVGSGTKLAMEDAIALARRLAAAPGTSAPAVEEALVAYEEARRIDVLKL